MDIYSLSGKSLNNGMTPSPWSYMATAERQLPLQRGVCYGDPSWLEFSLAITRVPSLFTVETVPPCACLHNRPHRDRLCFPGPAGYCCIYSFLTWHLEHLPSSRVRSLGHTHSHAALRRLGQGRFRHPPCGKNLQPLSLLTALKSPRHSFRPPVVPFQCVSALLRGQTSRPPRRPFLLRKSSGKISRAPPSCLLEEIT